MKKVIFTTFVCIGIFMGAMSVVLATQKNMAASNPVVIASDQSGLPIGSLPTPNPTLEPNKAEQLTQSNLLGLSLTPRPTLDPSKGEQLAIRAGVESILNTLNAHTATFDNMDANIADVANHTAWNGPSRTYTNIRIADQVFNASSTPVRIATPIATTTAYDVFFEAQNVGTVGGSLVLYADGTSWSIYLAPGGGTVQHNYWMGLVSNAPVSFGGDATAGVTVKAKNIILEPITLP